MNFIESASMIRLYIVKSTFRAFPRHITAGPNSKEVLVRRVETATMRTRYSSSFNFDLYSHIFSEELYFFFICFRLIILFTLIKVMHFK